MGFIGLLIFWLLCAFACEIMANAKGRSGCLHSLLGLLFGPLWVIVTALMPTDTDALERRSVNSGKMRRCVYCAEAIRNEAVVCRYCGHEIEPLPAPTFIQYVANYAGPLGALVAIVIGLYFAGTINAEQPIDDITEAPFPLATYPSQFVEPRDPTPAEEDLQPEALPSAQGDASPASDAPSDASPPDQEMEGMKSLALSLDEQCRGGAHAPDDAVCRRRDKAYDYLKFRGVCWAYSDPAIAPPQYNWHDCSQASP
ncbi:hypothetical protein [Novosphingobium resinovorum]|uniref:hypothetical protein n=1 Tax=Novosphingobium resinovorum TaxID=158500 RepID=UPI0012E9E30A|nr:hypothetical protein [Novosphingobium resinovorum]